MLNPDKTKLVIFGSRQMTAKVTDFRLFLLGKELEPVKAARDLGVTPGFLLRFVKGGKKFPIAGNFVTCPHAGGVGAA